MKLLVGKDGWFYATPCTGTSGILSAHEPSEWDVTQVGGASENMRNPKGRSLWK